MMDNQLILVIILAIILIIFKLFLRKENFDVVNLSQYNNDYNKCYNNEGTIMIDLKGNSVCLPLEKV